MEGRNDQMELDCSDYDDPIPNSKPPEPREDDFEWIEHHKGKGFFSYGVDTHIVVKREDLQWLINQLKGWFEIYPTAIDIGEEEEWKRIKEEYNL